MIDDSSIIRRKPDLITAGSADESVVLDSATGMFFQFNPSAAQMWDLIETPRTLAALVDSITEQFDVTPEACRADIVLLIETLRERGLVETV